MPKERKSGSDYKKEFDKLTEKLASLDAHVRKRVFELAKMYPEAQLTKHERGKDLTKEWVQNLLTGDVIFLIKRIEKWAADNHKHRQMTIDEVYLEVKENLDDTLKNLS